MRRWLRIVLVAAFYFVSVYMAVLALEPTLAVPAGWFAVLLARLAYLGLDAIAKNEEGMLFGIFYLLPFSCLAAGLLWWILRLLGFWMPLRGGSNRAGPGWRQRQ